MKKNILQKMLIFAILIFSILNMTSLYATNYIPSDISPSIIGGYASKVQDFGANAIGIMIWVGYAVSLGMLLFIGIKYVMASADERASLKGMLVKLFIGACIIFMSSVLVNVAISIFKTN